MNNFEQSLDKILLEFDLVSQPGATNKKARVYTKTTAFLVRKLIQEWSQIGGYLVKGQLILWNRDELGHEDIDREYSIKYSSGKSEKNPIPFYIFDHNRLELSPSSWMGVDPEKDILKVQKASPAFKSLIPNVDWFIQKPVKRKKRRTSS